MRRLERAIAEIESLKAALLNPRNKGWNTPSELIAIGLLNTALAVLAQVQVISPLAVMRSKIDPKADRVAEMIGQVNAEIRDEEGEV